MVTTVVVGARAALEMWPDGETATVPAEGAAGGVAEMWPDGEAVTVAAEVVAEAAV